MNPELRRNFWLEITVHRLIAMPIVLGLAFITLAALDNDDGRHRMVSWMAMAGFGVLTLLWGTRLATNSIFDEMTQKTWDWQRLSTLGPWTMTWGKLFGATAFAWYGGLMCLAVYVVTADPEFAGDSPLKLALTAILMAVLLHAGSMTIALHTSRRISAGSALNRRSVSILLVLVLINVVPFILARNFQSGAVLRWFGRPFQAGDFLLASTAMFAAWAVVGAYRAMCQSLAVRTMPWVWVMFLLFLTIYCAGFIANVQRDWIPPRYAILISGFGWSLMLTYLMVFTEPTGPTVIRRVLQKIQSGQWRRALEELPCWPLTWAFAAFCAVGLATISLDIPVSLAWPRQMAMAPIPLVLLALRDAAILLFFFAASKPNRAVATTIVYLLVLSWILPWLLYAMNLNLLARIVLPLGRANSAEQIASAVVQAGIAVWLACHRIQTHFSSYRRADGD
jgi:hypothetical protein